jgi:Hypothetical glycosyl hydrolase family 15/Carbohydrate binding domain
MSSPTLRLRLAAVLAALLLLGPASPARAQNYPRLGLYGSIMGDGYPYYSNVTGLVDPVALDQVARYHEVILDASPLTEYRPDVLAQLRQRRPDIHLLAYVLGHEIWPANSADSTVHFPTRYRHLVRDLNGFLYNRAGGEYSYGNVNLAKKDVNGRFIVAEGIADLFQNAIVSTGLWDGIFMDIYCEAMGWTQSPPESIDIARAGYSNLATFDAAWKAGGDTLTNRLRRIAGPNFILVGNCATSTRYTSMNGWMHENFPFQNGGTWYENMFRTPGGYFTDEANFRSPTHDYLFTATQGTLPYSTNNARKVRFGLGSAALGSGFGVFGPSDRVATTAPYQTWWYDEYAVNRSTGFSTGNLSDTGWLGQPLAPAYQMIWAGNGSDAVTNADFETDVSGWSLPLSGGVLASFARDATTAGKGTASTRITITLPGAVDWYAAFSTTSTLTVFQNNSYAATFWAKASTPRTITVVASTSTGGAYAYRGVDLTTTWKQYQTILIPNGSGSSKLQFYVGLNSGSVWIDDAHLQLGATNLYRRDFQNGMVLVNPSTTPLTVPLPTTYQKIHGLVDPIVNTGGPVTSVTVDGNDALFLIGDDFVRPAPILDLHVKP